MIKPSQTDDQLNSFAKRSIETGVLKKIRVFRMESFIHLTIIFDEHVSLTADTYLFGI